MRAKDITSRVETFVENYASVNIHIDRDGTDNDSMKGAVTVISAWSKSENEFDIDNNCGELVLRGRPDGLFINDNLTLTLTTTPFVVCLMIIYM